MTNRETTLYQSQYTDWVAYIYLLYKLVNQWNKQALILRSLGRAEVRQDDHLNAFPVHTVNKINVFLVHHASLEL